MAFRLGLSLAHYPVLCTASEGRFFLSAFPGVIVLGTVDHNLIFGGVFTVETGRTPDLFQGIIGLLSRRRTTFSLGLQKVGLLEVPTVGERYVFSNGAGMEVKFSLDETLALLANISVITTATMCPDLCGLLAIERILHNGVLPISQEDYVLLSQDICKLVNDKTCEKTRIKLILFLRLNNSVLNAIVNFNKKLSQLYKDNFEQPFISN